MSATALSSLPYRINWLAEDFSVLVRAGLPARWVILRDGRRMSVH